MIRIGKLTDYGLVLLARFAMEPQRIRTTAELATETGLEEPTVAKVLKMLARDGTLSSRRGREGGYRLAFEAHQISVARIVNALEGPVRLTDCCSDGESAPTCQLAPVCRIHGGVRQINSSLSSILEKTTLADLLGDAPIIQSP